MRTSARSPCSSLLDVLEYADGAEMGQKAVNQKCLYATLLRMLMSCKIPVYRMEKQKH